MNATEGTAPMNASLQQIASTCRFCRGTESDGTNSLVKYGVRHYAHYRCYLEAGKDLGDLHAWQIKLFPYLLLEQKGLLARAKSLVHEEDRAETTRKAEGR